MVLHCGRVGSCQNVYRKLLLERIHVSNRSFRINKLLLYHQRQSTESLFHVKGVKAVFSFFFIFIEAVQQEKVQLTQINSTSKFSVITIADTTESMYLARDGQWTFFHKNMKGYKRNCLFLSYFYYFVI